jgi:hypothetical protein
MKKGLLSLFAALLFSGLSSCIYSTKYVATYSVEPQITLESTATQLKGIVAKLADDQDLKPKAKKSDVNTQVFNGKTCHKFKFTTSEADTATVLTLNYRGLFGSRETPPYDTFLINLTDSINASFSSVTFEATEKSNRKMEE